MTYAEYVAYERASDAKHEYVNGLVYAMAGGTPEHARLQARMAHLLAAALRGRPSEPFSSDLRVKIEATGRATYPDVTVVCERLDRAEGDADAVTNPTLIVEVLSETTEADDRGDKWAHYQRLASLQHYLLVSQGAQRVEIFTREQSGWHYDDVRTGRLALPALGIEIEVEELYARALGA